MILKKLVYQPDKKVHPLIGLLLFCISIVLMLLTGPFGFLYGILHSLFKKGIRGLGEYLLQLAISIDQLGNVLMQHLLNLLWIKRGGYVFGNRDETISSALGRNKELQTLSAFGRFIDRLLDRLDPNHSLNSIDYYIEPDPKVIDRLVWVHLREGKLLTLKFLDQESLELPGGQRSPALSDAANLEALMTHELGIRPLMETLTYLHTFESPAEGFPLGYRLRQTCYTADYRGDISTHPAVEAVQRIGIKNIDRLSGPALLVAEYLIAKDLMTT